MTKTLEAYYGLPTEVRYCTRCVMSNQRPASYPEFKHTPARRTPTLNIDVDGVCDACHAAEVKQRIDWVEREKELVELLDQYRSKDGSYDCIVPGSGGKDSCFAVHVLKYKYGMHPLTVTWPPIIYTDVGLRNWRNWLEIGGFDNVSVKPNGRVQKLLTRLSIENLLHPFQTFILGQKNLAPKLAARFGIELVFYGENEAEYGNPLAENNQSLREKSYFTYANIDDLHLGGVSVKKLRETYGLTMNDLNHYLPLAEGELVDNRIDVRYLGYYLKWVPQEAYYYSVEHCGFTANPDRTEGTYSKYNSLDDKIDGLHYYTTWIKFGLGRASYDASQEIRNRHLLREEGIALVKRFDGEIPIKHFAEVMDYIELSPDKFHALCDAHRSPHLWEKRNEGWKLRHPIWEVQ